MVRIYNATDDTYQSIESFISAYDEDDTDTYYIHFYYRLLSLFDKAKERTALRGKYARDENNNPMIDRYAMTADEEEFFDQMLEVGSGEIYRKFLAWAKNVFNSYQYKVTHDFGNTLEYTGEINKYDDVMTQCIVHDYSKSWTANALIGLTLTITSGQYKGQTASITDNSEQMALLDSNPGDLQGVTYKITGSSTVEENSLQYFLTMPTTPYFDLLNVADQKLEEALVIYTIKEWYRLSGLYEDAALEEQRYGMYLDEVKSLLMMKAETTRRRAGFWKDF